MDTVSEIGKGNTIVSVSGNGNVSVSGRQEVGMSKTPSSSPVSLNSLNPNPVPSLLNPKATPFEGKTFSGQSDTSSDTESKQTPPVHEASQVYSLTSTAVLGNKIPITGLEIAQMWEAEADADRYPTSGSTSEPKKGCGLTSL